MAVATVVFFLEIGKKKGHSMLECFGGSQMKFEVRFIDPIMSRCPCVVNVSTK